MLEIGICEAKTRLAELLKQVEKEKLVTITNRGIPAADLIPSASRIVWQTNEAIAAIKSMRKPNGINQGQFNAMRLSGRR